MSAAGWNTENSSVTPSNAFPRPLVLVSRGRRGEKAVVQPPLVSAAREDLPTVLRGQSALDVGADGIAQEMHRAVAQEPVPAAGVLAPVVVPIAGVVYV